MVTSVRRAGQFARVASTARAKSPVKTLHLSLDKLSSPVSSKTLFSKVFSLLLLVIILKVVFFSVSVSTLVNVSVTFVKNAHFKNNGSWQASRRRGCCQNVTRGALFIFSNFTARHVCCKTNIDVKRQLLINYCLGRHSRKDFSEHGALRTAFVIIPRIFSNDHSTRYHNFFAVFTNINLSFPLLLRSSTPTFN